MRTFFFLLILTTSLTAAIHQKSAWIKEGFSSFASGDFPRLKAASYWHENWESHLGKSILLRVDSTFFSLEAYKKGVKAKSFVTIPEFESVNGRQILSAPASGMYHAAFTDFGGLENDVIAHKIFEFETLTRKKIAWASFSNNWSDKPVFPQKELETILSMERVPHIRIMVRHHLVPEQFGKMTFDRLLNGEYDDLIKKWAEKIQALNHPVLVEFCPEANGDWFPWSGKHITAEKYVRVHQRLVDLTRSATHLTWFFHLNAGSVPGFSYRDFYPGDAYADWIGISLYGPTQKSEAYRPFKAMLSNVYPELAQLSETKPLAILEWGIGEQN